MNRKSKLKINKGEEFKIAIKDIKDGDTIFYNQYKQALKMLETIVKTSHTIRENEQENRESSWQSEDYENNIIAFCGERGEGKSSAMCTFIKSLSNIDEELLEDMEIESDEINNTYFDEPIIIDPSQFDDVHNILDIVLAKIYEKFKDDYEKNEEVSERRKEELLNQFQKVYRQVSMINNQSKMLDDEFDYEGNIGKLSKLGESTRLKTSLKKLLELYLQFRKNNGNGKKKGNHQIIIAIDDLDLCSANAYKMAEQIRKYLILPQIVIVMAVKIEQLELCVQERNLIDFQKVFKAYANNNEDNRSNPKIYSEIFGMAERYVSKLIPKARRIYLPKVQSLENTDIVYQEDGKKTPIWSSQEKEGNSLVEKVLKLIDEKTGMVFLPEESGTSYLLPDNLRDMVNWIVRLASMDTPDEGDSNIYLENIQKFYEIFEMDVLDKMSLDGTGNKLKIIGKMDVVHMHANTKTLLDEICLETQEGYRTNGVTIAYKYNGERAGELFEVMAKFERAKKKIFDLEKEKLIYAIKTLYTITMNQLEMQKKLFKIKGFVNGYIWGYKFQNIMPREKLTNLDRSRFEIKTTDLYNTILDNYFKNIKIVNNYKESKIIVMNENIKQNISPLSEDSVRISSVRYNDRKREIMLIWTLIGIFSNTWDGHVLYGNSEKVIFDNSGFVRKLQISMENYIVNICNIKDLYYKINMTKLGIEVEEFNKIAEIIENENKDLINCMKKIISNIDLVLEIKEYCKEHNDYKEATGSRNKEIANMFLYNIYDYMQKQGIKIGLDDKEQIVQLKIPGRRNPIDVGEMYSYFIECGIEYRGNGKEQKILNQKYEELMKKYEEIISGDNYLYKGKGIQKFSSYFKNMTAKNVKTNLEKMAANIYFLKQDVSHMDLRNRIQEMEKEIKDLYSKVIKIYVKDEMGEIEEEINRYRELAAEEISYLKKYI